MINPLEILLYTVLCGFSVSSEELKHSPPVPGAIQNQLRWFSSPRRLAMVRVMMVVARTTFNQSSCSLSISPR
jgi:hypothetical protein